MTHQISIKSLGLAAVLLGGIVGLNSAHAVLIRHNGAVIFFDDFESAPTVVPDIVADPNSDADPVPGTGSGWSIEENAPEHLQVTSDPNNTVGPAHQGNNFLHIRTDSTGFTDPRAKAQFNPVTGGTLDVEFAYRNNNLNGPTFGGNSELQITYYDPNGFFGNFTGPIIAADPPTGAGNFVAFENGVAMVTDTGVSIPQDENWHEIKISANLDTGIYSFELDGVPAGSTFDAGATNLSAHEIWFAPQGYNQPGTINPRFDLDAIANPAFADAVVWNPDQSGDWNDTQQWAAVNPAEIPVTPNANNHSALFGDAITSPRTVFTDDDVTVNAIQFDNLNKYVIAGTGSVNLAQDPNGPTDPTIVVLNGSHEFQVKVDLEADASVNGGTGTLDFNNQIDLAGNTLTLSGSVNINHSTIGGGTVSAASSSILGTAGSTDIGGDLALSSTGTLAIDLGLNNTDRFDVNGNATLDGVLDVILEAGFMPSGSYTVLTTNGTLLDNGLVLDGSDTGMFSLQITSSTVILNTLSSDADGNGIVDGFDFLLIQRNNPSLIPQWELDYGGPPSIAAAGGAAAVPEPASAALVLVGLVALGAAGSRRGARQRSPGTINN